MYIVHTFKPLLINHTFILCIKTETIFQVNPWFSNTL